VIDLSNAKAMRHFEFDDADLKLYDIDEFGNVMVEIDSYDYGKLGPLFISQDELKELLRLSEWMTSDG
jgi:hypothetical protein